MTFARDILDEDARLRYTIDRWWSFGTRGKTDIMDENANLPAIVPDVAAVARIKSDIDISDRSRLVTFGDRAQHSVVEFADRILAQTQNRELGNTGKLLSDILGKAPGRDYVPDR
jgi:uncharacterized protein YaaN involved in tellurite resistance